MLRSASNGYESSSALNIDIPSQDVGLKELGVTEICRCTEMDVFEVPICRCEDPLRDISPLLQVRWKRLILDEGNNATSSKTMRVVLADKLVADYRWIVTGTPTSNLIGLGDFGGQSVVADSVDEPH